MDAFLLSGLISAVAAIVLIEAGIPAATPERIRVEDETSETQRRLESLDD